jgi:hypothetical protein
LDDLFGFRWEPGSFKADAGEPLVYCPVRLRRPTPIRAVQCFTAAALQLRGAEIHLFIDDLGTPDFPIDALRETLLKWIELVGGRREQAQSRSFSKVLSAERPAGPDTADPWPPIRKWLGDTYDYMEKILTIAKLVPRGDSTFTLQDLNGRRPRRLLTPALVWSCLLFLHGMSPTRPLLTLGGYDERQLWQAWRESSTSETARVGHLYAPN